MSSERAREIGSRIRERREALGFTQDELARMTERPAISGNVISRWERGRNRPQSDSVDALATALGVSSAYLTFGREQAPASSPADTATLEAMREHLAGIDAKLGTLVSLLGGEGQDLGGLVETVLAQLGGQAPPRSGDVAPTRTAQEQPARSRRTRATG